MRDAGPSAALPFIDEVGEHISEFEGERRQLGIGADLVEPEKLLARKRRRPIRRCVVGGSRNNPVSSPASGIFGRGAPLRSEGIPKTSAELASTEKPKISFCAFSRKILRVRLAVGGSRRSSHPNPDASSACEIPGDAAIADDAGYLTSEALVHDRPPGNEGELVGVLDDRIFARDEFLCSCEDARDAFTVALHAKRRLFFCRQRFSGLFDLAALQLRDEIFGCANVPSGARQA